MKKIVLIIVMMAVFSTALRAQADTLACAECTRVSTDTLPCGVRMPDYWYSDWYDTTPWYLYGSARDSIHVYNDGRDTYYFHWTPSAVGLNGFCNAVGFDFDITEAFEQYAPNPIRVKGLWVMVSQYSGDMMNQYNGGTFYPVLDSARLPEYLYLYVPKSGADTNSGYPDTTWTDTTRTDTNYVYAGGMSKFVIHLNRIATVRWDTAHPKMMCLKKTLDPVFAGANAYCHVYEALFDTTYTIEGEFWIGGSEHSNTLSMNQAGLWFGHLHFPTLYLTFGDTWDRLHNPHARRASAHDPDGPFHGDDYPARFGPFGVITDGQRYVEVSVNDTAEGLGLYTAFYPDSSYQTIRAEANRGFRFSHWNDGVTDNPRTVYVTSDTSFTAYFDALPEYQVCAESDDEGLGAVNGGGQYYEGETARIAAVANRGACFVRWNDSVTDNPRNVVVTRDTMFTAYFDTLPQYRLNVYSNDGERGHVTGDGVFYEGEEATIRATAHAGYYFLRWADGPGYNPRSVVVTQDTSFTAIFWRKGEPVGVQEAVSAGVPFRLMPNPASGEVRFETDGEAFEGGVLAVRDAAGREVLRRVLARGTRTCTLKVSDLPSGTYFVTLTTAKGTSTRKLIIEN